MKKSGWQQLNWPNTLFLLLTPLIGLGGAIYLAMTGQLHVATLILAFVWMVVTGLAITAGYHRLFAHHAYQVGAFIRGLFLFFGAAAFQGSVLEWTTDHRNHHRYSETDKDPYNIQKGFWYAHIGWLFLLDTSRRDFSNVDDLGANGWIRHQHRYFWWWSITAGFMIPTLIAGLWGDWLGGFLLAGVLRVTLNHHFTFCVNSVCHTFGRRVYSLEQTGRDHWLAALFTYGEGFHNFHHQFPLDYRNGIRYYDYDPTKWLIWLFSRLGLARDLKKTSIVHLTRYRLRTDEQTFLLTSLKHGQEHLHSLRARILQMITHIEALEKSDKIKECRQQLRKARLELKYSLLMWSRLLKTMVRTSRLSQEKL
jgi:stearoyl-CoA desaturase (Delta-9 desaturase)